MKSHPLQPLIDIDKGNKISRLTILITIPCAFLFAIGVYIHANRIIEDNRQHIYTLVNGKALELAVKTNAMENRPVEIKDNAKIIMSLLFNVPPDPKALTSNLEHVKRMGDKSITNFINTLNEQRYYDNLIAAGAIQTIDLDSAQIQVDYANYPYTLQITCKQRVVRPSLITIKELTCKMNMLNCPRTDELGHGLWIENFNVISNQTLENYERKKEE